MNKRLNIVFIGRYQFPNGSAMTKRHRYYMDYLCTLPDVDVCNICTWKGAVSNPKHGMYRDKVEYYNTTLPKKVSSFLPIAKWTNRILEKKYRKDCVNIVIFSTYLNVEHMFVLWKAKKIGYKTVCDVVENYDAEGGGTTKQIEWAFKMSKMFFYKKMNAFIAISNQIKDVYQRYGKPILNLTNSAPVNQAPVKHAFHSPMRIVYTGTFASKDGLKFLVEGFNRFAEKVGDVAELILIGRGTSDSQTEATISNNRLIKRLGFVTEEELADIQSSADILCMTRCNSAFANYGFPFKLSEYMATGNTILATSVGDVPLYVKDKVNGLLVNPDSSDSIYEALNYAYNHPKECIEMGLKGIDTVKAYFDVEKNGDLLYRFCQKIAEE